jgi:hypothetical protein
MRRAILPGVSLALLLGACGADAAYRGLEIDVVSAPPTPVSVQPDRIEMVAGHAVQVKARPLFRNLDPHHRRQLTLRAEDEDLLDVYRGDDEGEFVLVALAAGRSCLRVIVDREDYECIDLRIEETLDE